MTLGLVLAIGESLKDFKSKGQDRLLVEQNIRAYSQNFEKVFVFSYENEKYPLYKNCQLITNRARIYRYLYSLAMPLIRSKEFKNCDVLRGLQVTGGIPCVVAKILYKKPFVINYGYDYEKISKIEKKYPQAFLYKIVTPIILKFATAVLVTTSSLAKKIKNIRTKNVYVIPNSVDIKKFYPERKKLKNSVKKLLFVGRLEPQKNLASFIEAVSILKFKTQLVFVGQGSQKNTLLKLAKRLKVNLRIIDGVAHDRLPQIYRQADIFVLPSFIEGHPKVLLEAMSTELACIGADTEGIREVITNKKTGLLSGTKPENIREAIEYLIKNPKTALQLGKRARKYVIDNYDFANLMKKENKLLKSLIK